MKKDCILAIDQGTTSSRAMVFDGAANVISVAQREFPQIYPEVGWVEHSPEAIWDTVLDTVRQAFEEAEGKGHKVAAIGITNQRETTLVWERKTGRPAGNAIVWQDRRTADVCRRLNAEGAEAEVQEKTGLLLDPYFSATKIAWILDHVDGAREKAERGELAFGTVDSYLVWRLTGGAHVTDATNASRTSLYNIHSGQWDEGLLKLFNVPKALLPRVMDCAAHFGDTVEDLLGRKVPILGVAGDQQAASIGQCCFTPGMVKSTYGTGCFVLMNTGDKAPRSKARLLTTVNYQLDGVPTYAVEGSIFVAGAAVQWLRDQLGVIKESREVESLAASLDGNQGVYMVPAFTGLGAPYWEPDARAAILGLTRGTGAAHIVRAALESVCYLTGDLIKAMEADGIPPAAIRVDGGMAANNWMLQFLSDVLDLEISRPVVMETTALGAAYLAGRQCGVYGGFEEFLHTWNVDRKFQPQMAAAEREELQRGWRKAVSACIGADARRPES